MMETQELAELCFPELLNSSCRKPSLHRSAAALLKVVVSFISLITVALNLLVIISVSHFRRLHTPTNILLLSLAGSDFLVGLFLMPLETFRFTTCWFLGDIVCILFFFLVGHIFTASIGHIVLISVDRYVAICLPLHYPTRITLVRVKYCVCLYWVWASSVSSFFLKDELIQSGRNNSCLGQCVIFINHVTGTFDLILNFIIPVTVIIVLYMRVFIVAVSQARAVRSHVTAVRLHKSAHFKKKKSELKAAKTLGVLVIVYLMCFCPYYGYSLTAVDLSNQSYGFFLVFIIYFNSCLNPLIYALFYPWFRKAVKLIVTLQILQPGSSEANIL